MYCRKCGKDLREDAMFCPKCGTQIVVSETKEEKEVIKKKPNMFLGIIFLVLLLVVILFVFSKKDKNEDVYNEKEDTYSEIEVSTMYENEPDTISLEETNIQETVISSEIKEEGITATYIEAGYFISQFEIIDNYLYVTTESTFLNTDINSISYEVAPNCDWYSYFTNGERGDTLSYEIIKEGIDTTHAYYAADRENYITDSATTYAIEVENGVVVAVYSINS